MLSVEQSECPKGDGSTVHSICLQYGISVEINQHLLSDKGRMGVWPSWEWCTENLQLLGDRRPSRERFSPLAHCSHPEGPGWLYGLLVRPSGSS